MVTYPSGYYTLKSILNTTVSENGDKISPGSLSCVVADCVWLPILQDIIIRVLFTVASKDRPFH